MSHYNAAAAATPRSARDDHRRRRRPPPRRVDRDDRLAEGDDERSRDPRRSMPTLITMLSGRRRDRHPLRSAPTARSGSSPVSAAISPRLGLTDRVTSRSDSVGPHEARRVVRPRLPGPSVPRSSALASGRPAIPSGSRRAAQALVSVPLGVRRPRRKVDYPKETVPSDDQPRSCPFGGMPPFVGAFGRGPGSA